MKYFLGLIEFAKKEIDGVKCPWPRVFSSSSLMEVDEKFSALKFCESNSPTIIHSKTEQECTLEEIANHQPQMRMTNFGGEHIANMLLEKFKSPFKSAVGTIPIFQTESSFYLKANTKSDNPDFMPFFSKDKLRGINISINNDHIREHFILEINFRMINAFQNR